MEKRRKLTDNDRVAIISLYQTGRAAREIARFMSINESTVHKVLRDNKIDAHYPARAEGAKQRKIEKRPSMALKVETPERGQITFDDLTRNPADVVPLDVGGETFGDDLATIIYKAVYNGVIDALGKGNGNMQERI